jgi:DNA-binding Lrp family transcriptional regulator
MNTEAHELWSVAEAALKIEGVKTTDAVTGEFDAIALVDFPKMDDLGRIIEKIQRLKGVIRTQSLITIPRPVRE